MLLTAVLAVGQSARDEYNKAEQLRMGGDLKSALGSYRKAIELDPDFADAHEAYTSYTRFLAIRDFMSWSSDSPEVAKKKAEQLKEADERVYRDLKKQYSAWSAQHPRKAVFVWILGTLDRYRDPTAAEQAYRRAVKLDPKFAAAWQSLAVVAEVVGRLDDSLEAAHQAVLAAPKDPSYLFYYAWIQRANQPEFRRLLKDVVGRFPNDVRSVEALYWLARTEPTDAGKIAVLEGMHRTFPPSKFSESFSGMGLLFTAYDHTDRAKALALAEEMQPLPGRGRTWPQLLTYTKAMIEAEELLKQGKGADALERLKNITVPDHMDNFALDLTRARITDTLGDTAKAYDELSRVYAASPTDGLQEAVFMYGKKLGKDAAAVRSNVASIQASNAKPGVPFSLGSYTSDKPITLDDFKGRVVLLNFWYPQCGPCRNEFPYIQAVLDKYKDRGFVILAVNVHPPEDNFVLPILRGFHLGFIPAKSDEDWASSAYGVRSQPTNFVLGRDGRIYFSPQYPITTPLTQRILEMQVEALLDAP